MLKPFRIHFLLLACLVWYIHEYRENMTSVIRCRIVSGVLDIRVLPVCPGVVSVLFVLVAFHRLCLKP